MSPKPTTTSEAIATTLAKKPISTPLGVSPSVFDALPNSAFIREAQLVQSPKRRDSPAPLPFSAPTLWRKVKAGTFPKPHRLSARVTAWKVGDVRDWINEQTAAA